MGYLGSLCWVKYWVLDLFINTLLYLEILYFVHKCWALWHLLQSFEQWFYFTLIRGVWWSKWLSSSDLLIQASCNVGQRESSMLGTWITLMWVTDMPLMPLFYLFLMLKFNISPPSVVCKSNTHLISSIFNFHLVSLTSSSWGVAILTQFSCFQLSFLRNSEFENSRCKIQNLKIWNLKIRNLIIEL